MKQVPEYLIIGNGKMAFHICHYFRYLSIPFKQWSRTANSFSKLLLLLQEASHVLILIKDDAIETFITEYLIRYDQLKRIHFSGSLETKLAYSAHPLCPFGEAKAYALTEYQNIPFFIDANGPDFSALLPGLNNPSYKIEATEKSYYHAMCVIANNFTTLIAEKFFYEMKNRFCIDKTDLMPFLEKTFDNIKSYPNIRFTGPLVRGDTTTLTRDLAALENDPFYFIFKNFIETFKGDSNDQCT